MRPAFVAFGVALSFGTGVVGQTPRVASSAFDVASVKPAPREILQQRSFACSFGAGGRFIALGPLQWLIACAYAMPQVRAGQEIIGLPPWGNADLFEIMAIAPADTATASFEDALGMLRTLLSDRFQLRTHRDTRELPIYRLVVARGDRRLGPALRPTSRDCTAWIAGGHSGPPPPSPGDLPCGRDGLSVASIRGSALTMARLAEMLSPRAGRLVQDDTDLSGTYDVDLRWTPDELRERLLRSDLPPGTLPQFNGVTLDPNGPGLFTALQEQLGLKLEAARGRADVLVIDSVQQPSPD